MTEAMLPRIVKGIVDGPLAPLATHEGVHGPLPELGRFVPAEMIRLVEQSGLRGRGGASFPTARKLHAVAARRGPKVVVVNGTEGEPVSKKDRVLMRDVPHLITDGAVVAAHAVGAREVLIAISEADKRGAHSLEQALAERWGAGLSDEPRCELVAISDGFVSGQESALVSTLSGEDGKPTFGPRPFERGVRRLPTLVQNAETVANLALIARHGPRWFRELGPSDDPGSRLLTVAGAVGAPGVYEIESGMALADLLELAHVEDGLAGVLVGGYFGSWVTVASIPDVMLSNERPAPYGVSVGAGVIVALSDASCPVAETTRVADYLARESAGQCGPCVHGLAAIADTVQRLVSGTADGGAYADLERWASELPGRGACQHPDGAARFVVSALRAFGEEFRDHARRGPCGRCAGSPVLPTPIPVG